MTEASNTPSVFLSDPDVTLWHGDALMTLLCLPSESVDCVVTSPPYWGLRDYGQEGQLGLEPTPEQYVERMVGVFREVRRVLAAHGTVWLNLGDSYAGSWGAQSRPNGNDIKSSLEGGSMLSARQIEAHPRGTRTGSLKNTSGLKQKDLVGIPWRVAFALQADGWYLRSDIIWSKPNPMPESVTDRPTKAHEYVFLLSKQPRYFFDQEAVRERYGDPARQWWNEMSPEAKNPDRKDGGGIQSKRARGPDGRRKTGVLAGDGSIQHRDGERWPNFTGRNIRSVWEIATQPYPEAHFATFPEELARRCIAAGCPEKVCGVCCVPLTRIIENKRRYIISEGGSHADGTYRVRYSDEPHDVNFKVRDGDPKAFSKTRWHNEPQTLGFTDCGHSTYRPGIVLDPFIGSGTVAFVARKLGRRSIGVDLSAEYLKLAARRLQQQSLFAGAL